LRLLLDTHAALWWLLDDTRIGSSAAVELETDSNDVLLSAVVVWEIAIKRGRGKLSAPPDLMESLLEAGAAPLPVTLEHAAGVEALPQHHSDPFDRLLIAQARNEGAVIVTRDAVFGAYGVPVVW
jgi:PIN domain nuclease of toxin-antitoxin system